MFEGGALARGCVRGGGGRTRTRQDSREWERRSIACSSWCHTAEGAREELVAGRGGKGG